MTFSHGGAALSGRNDNLSTTPYPRRLPNMLERLGRYQVLSELGRGAMGIVYRARDPLIDREVAIKTIRVDLSRDELALFEARFFTEVRAAGRLSHANIVTVHDAGREGGLVYVAMELLEGPSLADLLAAHTPIPPARIAAIGAQIADALAYAHAEGIVHRDVKPANIILVRDRVPKLTDFGVARLPSAGSTLAGTLIGSPKYMSPEQVTAQPVDGRSDVFSLGVVLYELLTGEAAFGADDLHAVMHRVVHHSPPAPATLNPRVPAALDSIVSQAIAKRPEDRYPTARALATDLSRFVRGEIVVVPPGPARAAPASRPMAAGDETLELRRQPPVDAPSSATPPTPAERPRRRSLAIALVATLGIAVLAGVWVSRTGDAQSGPATPAASVTSAPIATLAESRDPGDAHAGARATDAPSAPRASAPPQSAAPAAKPETPSTASAAPPAPQPAPKPARRAASSSPVVAPAPPPSPERAPAGSPPEAKLLFAIAPWGEVYVDGKHMGIAPPLRELSVPAGRRTITIRNADLKPHVVVLDLREDAAVKIKHQFR